MKVKTTGVLQNTYRHAKVITDCFLRQILAIFVNVCETLLNVVIECKISDILIQNEVIIDVFFFDETSDRKLYK